jgi:type 1 fimbria pilin
MNIPTLMPRFVIALIAGAAVSTASFAATAATTDAKSGGDVTVTGEVLDMACYLDHGAHGAKHADCAKKCISSGLPVGLKGTDGKTYLLIGEHMPANDELAKHAAETITVRGKLVERDGINLLENISIVKA